MLGGRIVKGPSSEDRNVARHDRLLGPRIPADMDEVRHAEYTNGAAVLVTSEGNEVEGGRTGSHR